MRRMIPLVLVLVLVWCLGSAMSAGSPGPDPFPRKEQAEDASTESKARGLLPGNAVELGLENGEKLRGRVVEVREDQLVVQWVNGDRIEKRQVVLAEVKTIKVLRAKPSTAKSIAQYVFVGALGGAVGVGELAKENRR